MHAFVLAIVCRHRDFLVYMETFNFQEFFIHFNKVAILSECKDRAMHRTTLDIINMIWLCFAVLW